MILGIWAVAIRLTLLADLATLVFALRDDLRSIIFSRLEFIMFTYSINMLSLTVFLFQPPTQFPDNCPNDTSSLMSTPVMIIPDCGNMH